MDESEDIDTYYESYPTLSSYGDSNCTPFPSMTKSQKAKLNDILQGSMSPTPLGPRKPIGYVSTFNEQDINEPIKIIEHTAASSIKDSYGINIEHVERPVKQDFRTLAKPIEIIEHTEQKQNENYGCCIIM